MQFIPISVCTVLWLIRLVIWNTPNNVLHQHGLGSAVAQDLLISTLVGLVCWIVVAMNKANYRATWFYWLSIWVCASLFLVPIIVCFLIFIAVMFFGAST